jgi:hypothetical protein
VASKRCTMEALLNRFSSGDSGRIKVVVLVGVICVLRSIDQSIRSLLYLYVLKHIKRLRSRKTISLSISSIKIYCELK